jgi:hypothetical protein
MVSHIRFFQLFAIKRIEANQISIRWIFASICKYSYTNIRFISLWFASKYLLRHGANLKDEIFASICFDSLENIRVLSCPCCMSILHVNVHTACPCPYCISMSMQHVHVYATCSCLWCMSRSVLLSTSMLHVNVHASSLCPCCMFMFMQQGHRHVA